MSNNLNSIEKTGKNIDEAIEAALVELGVTRDDVEVEVLEEGGKGGLFGLLGAKDAKVLVSVKAPASPEECAEKFLSGLFKMMNVEVDVVAKTEDRNLSVNLVGSDMGIIIGKRGETLDAVQYLTSLTVNRAGGEYVKVSVDTENYREKRQDALVSLANRLASKVGKSGRRFTLEPMNPYERRIIHATLQDHADVTTYSVGDEPMRKVVISPKNPKPMGDRPRRNFDDKERKPRTPYVSKLDSYKDYLINDKEVE